MCGSLMWCLVSAARPLGITVPDGSSRQPDATKSSIHEVVLRDVVRTRCQVMLCLLSVEKKPVGEALLRSLGGVGRVDVAAADDYDFENGATKAFARRKALIVDITGVKLRGHSEAAVEVSIYATALDASLCRYRAQRRQATEWVVDKGATRCTL